MQSKKDTSSPHLERTREARRPRKLWGLLGVVAAVGLTSMTAAPALAASYSITDLGNLGYPVAFASAINASGQVAGGSYLAEEVPTTGCSRHVKRCVTHPEHAFLYSSGTMTDLGTLGGIYAAATAINVSGELAGFSRTSGGNNEAFIDQNGKMAGLGSLAAGGSSEAFAINGSGAVAGESSVSEGGPHAFLYSGGKMTDLGLLPGGSFTAASAINDANEVVGSGDLANSDERAFLYRKGKMVELGTLGGPNSAAQAINKNGQVVGSAQTAGDSEHPFLYSAGKMTDLGAFNLESEAYAINDNGVIVGQTYGVSKSGASFFHAFVYSGGKFQDLNNLIPAGSGFELTNATGINDTGQIVVTGYDASNGQNHALVLTPN